MGNGLCWFMINIFKINIPWKFRALLRKMSKTEQYLFEEKQFQYLFNKQGLFKSICWPIVVKLLESCWSMIKFSPWEFMLTKVKEIVSVQVFFNKPGLVLTCRLTVGELLPVGHLSVNCWLTDYRQMTYRCLGELFFNFTRKSNELLSFQSGVETGCM